MIRFLIKLWRIWFYLLSAVPVLLLFPLLAFLLVLPNGYFPFFGLHVTFGHALFCWALVFVDQKDQYPFDNKKSYLLVANHSSYIDIMLMFAAAPNPFVFVGKKS